MVNSRAMLGITAREVSVTEHENGDFEAVVDSIRATDGAVIGRGSAIVSNDETTGNLAALRKTQYGYHPRDWKAFRLSFAWIMTLAGYEGTPAEEMIDAEFVESRPANLGEPSALMDIETALAVTSS